MLPHDGPDLGLEGRFLEPFDGHLPEVDHEVVDRAKFVHHPPVLVAKTPVQVDDALDAMAPDGFHGGG
jgi:hypothetical protein